MAEPKTTEYSRSVRSETAFAFTGGMKENLTLQAQLAINRLMRVIGPNARGAFHFRVSFVPDGRKAEK